MQEGSDYDFVEHMEIGNWHHVMSSAKHSALMQLSTNRRSSRDGTLPWSVRSVLRPSKIGTITDCEKFAVQCYLREFGCYQKIICVIMFVLNIYMSCFFSLFTIIQESIGQKSCQMPENFMELCENSCSKTLLSSNHSQSNKGDTMCLDKVTNKAFTRLDPIVLYTSMFLGPYLTDVFGRRPVLVYGMALQFFSSIAQYFSFRVKMRIATMLIGYFICLTTDVVGLVLLMELVGSQMHVTIIFLYEFCDSLADLLFNGAYTLFNDWNIIDLCSLCFCGIIAALVWLIPESPLWLVNANKLEDATRTIALLFKFEKDHPLSLDKERIRGRIEKAWRIHRCSPQSSKQSFMNMFYYRCLRKNFYIYLLICFTLGMCNYLSALSHLNNMKMSNWVFPCCDMIGSGAFILTQRYFGRKNNVIYGVYIVMGMLVLHAVCAEVDIHYKDSVLTVLQHIAANCLEANCSLYFFEYWPTALRAHFLGYGMMAQRSGEYAMLGLIKLLTKAKWITYAIPACLFIYISIETKFFPETKGYPLSLTLRDAEQLTVFQYMDRL